MKDSKYFFQLEIAGNHLKFIDGKWWRWGRFSPVYKILAKTSTVIFRFVISSRGWETEEIPRFQPYGFRSSLPGRKRRLILLSDANAGQQESLALTVAGFRPRRKNSCSWQLFRLAMFSVCLPKTDGDFCQRPYVELRHPLNPRQAG